MNENLKLSVMLLAALAGIAMVAIVVLILSGITDPTLLVIFGSVVGLAVNSIAALTQIRD